MPQYDVNSPDGKTYTVNAPDGATEQDAISYVQKNFYSDSKPKKPDTTTKTDRFVKGLRDPIDGAAQLLTKMLPDGVVNAGNNLNNWLADKTGMVGRLPAGGVDQQVRQNEAQYQDARGSEAGFDGMRVLGNVLNPANLAIASTIPAAASLAGRVGFGALGGGLTSAFNPVTTEGDFSTEKGKQIGVGAMFGGGVPLVTGALARVVSPNASKNTNLALLKNEGVSPTVGQSLGGRWNSLEEKLTSVPILGDMISNARSRSMQQFDNAAINRASGQVGAKVDGAGQSAIREAGDAISSAYDDAISKVKFLKFDNQFSNDLTQLQSMAQNLTPPMRSKFNTKLNEVVGGRMSGGGSMLGDTYKKVDSEIGMLAAKFQKSAVASESELGDAFAQLQSLLKQQAMRSNPSAAKALNAADAAWANLVRVEGAGKAAQNAEGIFTPAQLNSAIRAADGSVRNRAVSRGTALMQDLGNAGQQVLGNRVPNSFTTDRALIAGGALGSYFVNPAIPLGLLGAGAMYTAPMQGLLSGAVSARPQLAQPIADAIRKGSPALVPLGAQVGLGLLN